MAINYFTETSKEDGSLTLMKDLVTWLALRHNLEVKVIRSDNEMNRIKTKAWCNDVRIRFKPCAPDTHVQNGGAERFGRTILEKARAMRLSANLHTSSGGRSLAVQRIYTIEYFEHRKTGRVHTRPFIPTFLRRKKCRVLHLENLFCTT